MIKPNKLTIDALQRRGCHVATVERYDPRSRRNFDLFGFIDVLAIDLVSMQIVGIQATTRTNFSHRLKKIRATEHRQIALDWLRTGNSLQLWAWGCLANESSPSCRIEHLKTTHFSD
jgi:hypothetical protein